MDLEILEPSHQHNYPHVKLRYDLTWQYSNLYSTFCDLFSLLILIFHFNVNPFSSGICDGHFTANFFSCSSVCHLCILQKEHDKLKEIFHVLQDSITSNIGVMSPATLPTNQSLSYAAAAAISFQVTVSVLECVSLAQKEAHFTPVKDCAHQSNNKEFFTRNDL